MNHTFYFFTPLIKKNKHAIHYKFHYVTEEIVIFFFFTRNYRSTSARTSNAKKLESNTNTLAFLKINLSTLYQNVLENCNEF